MNFQSIPDVDTPKLLLDRAMNDARRAMRVFTVRRGSLFERKRRREEERLKLVATSLAALLARIAKAYPNLDALPEFYVRLIEATLDLQRLRQSLGATAWAKDAVLAIAKEERRRISRSGSQQALLTAKRAAFGRVSSVLNRIGKNLAYLNGARKAMRQYPDIKEDLFTVAIAGFPNVGKSTLLRKITSARPEVAAYAFTTKGLNIGYFTYRHHRIQVIDTPGTLARPEKMNTVERIADLALTYAAHMIVYVYDPTEPYPLDEQRRLDERVRRRGKPLLHYASKADLIAPPAHLPEITVDAALLKQQIQEVFEKERL